MHKEVSVSVDERLCTAGTWQHGNKAWNWDRGLLDPDGLGDCSCVCHTINSPPNTPLSPRREACHDLKLEAEQLPSPPFSLLWCECCLYLRAVKLCFFITSCFNIDSQRHWQQTVGAEGGTTELMANLVCLFSSSLHPLSVFPHVHVWVWAFLGNKTLYTCFLMPL